MKLRRSPSAKCPLGLVALDAVSAKVGLVRRCCDFIKNFAAVRLSDRFGACGAAAFVMAKRQRWADQFRFLTSHKAKGAESRLTTVQRSSCSKLE